MDKIRVLIVNADPAVCVELAKMLAHEQHLELAGVETDGSKAVEHAQSLGAHRVVIDVDNPGMSGIEVARTLALFNPNVLVFMTMPDEMVSHEVLVEAFRAGAKDMLSLPIEPEVFCYVVESAYRIPPWKLRGEK